MKKEIISFFIIFFSLSTFANTIAYWNLDGNLTSSVGSSNLTGTLYGSENWSTNISNNAPGTKSLLFSDSYMKVNNTTSITTGLNALTIEAFFNPSTINQYGTIYSEDGTIRSTYLGYFGTEGYLRFFIGQGTISPLVSNCEILDVYISLVTDTWYHIAATFDGNAKTISLYLNGNQIGTRNVSLSNIPISGRNATIGGWSYTNNSLLFSGYIDEVRLSDQVLESSQFLNAMAPEPNVIIFCQENRYACIADELALLEVFLEKNLIYIKYVSIINLTN